MENKISIVVGSWGSYIACNERALGSSWLCLNDFDSWEDIEEDLFSECNEIVQRYFDYEAFGRDLSFNNYYLTSYGILNIR